MAGPSDSIESAIASSTRSGGTAASRSDFLSLQEFQSRYCRFRQATAALARSLSGLYSQRLIGPMLSCGQTAPPKK